jgi:solute carrier family 25 protein 38
MATKVAENDTPGHRRNESVKDVSSIKAASHFYAGFVSGLTSSVLLQPLDLLKTRVQQSKDQTILKTLREISNVKSLWRGTVPSAIRTSCGGALYFTTLNMVRTQIALFKSGGQGDSDATHVSVKSSSYLPKLAMIENLASGAFVRGAVGFVTMPITMIKVRFESSLYQYTSMASAARNIYELNGISGFFKGYGATFARDAPYAGLYVLFYEKQKEVFNKMFPTSESTRSSSTAAVINSGSAVSAAALATTITAPFDTVKTRIQLEPSKYRTFASAALMIAKQDGLLGLFDGLSLRLSRKALSSGIGWCIYEELVRRR